MAIQPPAYLFGGGDETGIVEPLRAPFPPPVLVFRRRVDRSDEIDHRRYLARLLAN
jgi:hypothetical protein